MKKLIIIRGPLGVGKTTISKILAEKIGADYISLDKIIDDNDFVEENGIPLGNFLKANKIISEMLSESDKPVIVDGCFYYQEQIDDLQKRFNDNLEIFSLLSDVEKCIVRDAEREKTYGEGSARYVHGITTKVKAGHEIHSDDLTVEETVGEILKELEK